MTVALFFIATIVLPPQMDIQAPKPFSFPFSATVLTLLTLLCDCIGTLM